jgi:hypothetical protein
MEVYRIDYRSLSGLLLRTTCAISSKIYRNDLVVYYRHGIVFCFYKPKIELLMTLTINDKWLNLVVIILIFMFSLSGLHRSNCWPDFNETSQEWSVPSLVVHIVNMFCLATQNGCQIYKKNYLVPLLDRSNCWWDFIDTSQKWSVPSFLCISPEHVLLSCTNATSAIIRKVISIFLRSNSWRDLNVASEEWSVWSVKSLVVHIAGTFCSTAQNGH